VEQQNINNERTNGEELKDKGQKQTANKKKE